MDKDILIQALRHQPRAVRSEALAALIGELDPHEWREVRNTLNARSFQFDLIGSLPLELVVRVFAHLDIGAPYRLQSVSRTWNHALRSADLVKSRLRAWYGETSPAAIALLDDYGHRAHHAEHVFRMCAGRPYTSVTIPLYSQPSDPILVDDTFAWLSDDDDRVISVCNLRTGKTRREQTPGREIISRLVASEELIAFTTVNKCYVQSLDGLQSNKFRLTGPLWDTIECRGQYVVCLNASLTPATVDTGPGSIDTGSASIDMSIYIWDFNTGHGKSFKVEVCGDLTSSRRKLSSSIALLPDPKTKSVVIFSYCWPVCGKGTNNPVVQNNPRTVCHSRFSFKGELIGYGQQSFPNFDIQAFDHFCPTATQGRSALRALVASDMDWSASAPQIVQLEFDEISGQFLDPRLPSTSTDDGELSPGIASWNAANYQLVYTKTRFNKIETVCLGTLNDPLFRGLDSPVEARLAAPAGEKMSSRWDTGPIGRILINETYAVTLVPNGVKEMRIYCFEKGLEVQYEAIEKCDIQLNARALRGPPSLSDESDERGEFPIVW